MELLQSASKQRFSTSKYSSFIAILSLIFAFQNNLSKIKNLTKTLVQGVARDEWRVTYLNTNLNCTDMATKSLPGGEKRTIYLLFVALCL